MIPPATLWELVETCALRDVVGTTAFIEVLWITALTSAFAEVVGMIVGCTDAVECWVTDALGAAVACFDVGMTVAVSFSFNLSTTFMIRE